MVQFDVERNLIALALRKNTTHAVFWVACGPFIVIAEPPPSSGRKRAVPTYTVQSTSVGFAALVQAGNSTGGSSTVTASANTTGTSTSTTLQSTSAVTNINASLTQGSSVASANTSAAITAIPPSESVRSATNEVSNTDATAAFSPWAISTIVLAVLLACVLLGLLEYFVVLRRCSRAPTTDIDASAAAQPKAFQQQIEMNTARDASPLSERVPGYSIPSPPASSPSNYDQVPPIAVATSDSIKPW